MQYWKLADRIVDDRPYLLDTTETFEGLVRRLTGAAVIEARWEWAKDQALTGRARARFELAVDPRDYDLFFNGCDGYRARFYRSVEEGVLANAHLLLVMRQFLCAAASCWGLDANHPVTEIDRSLVNAGAKGWISEVELNEREPHWQPTDVEEIRDEIHLPRWMDGVRTYAVQAERAGVLKNAILAGTRAFQGSRISVFGSFIVPGQPSFGAMVAPDKARRPCQIHDYGFS